MVISTRGTDEVLLAFAREVAIGLGGHRTEDACGEPAIIV
jgi:hypothetical protein